MCFERTYPAVALLIKYESFQILVDVDALFVAGEEFLGLIERVGKVWRVIRRRIHGLSCVCRNIVVRGRLVNAHTLHAVGSVDVVPCKDVPKAEVVLGVDGVAADGVLVRRVVGAVLRAAG